MNNDNRTVDVVRIGNVSVPFIVGALVVLVSIIIFCEWTFAVKIIARYSPTDSSMKFNASLVFFLYGLSLLLQHSDRSSVKIAAKALIGSGMLLAALTLSQYLFGVDLGIDELFVRDHVNPDITSTPGRMSPLVACNFLLTGTALVYWRKIFGRNLHLAENVAVVAYIMPVIAASGYLFSASSLYSFASVTGVALFTALLFLLLLTGILAVYSDRGFASVLLSQTRGGLVLRFLLPSSLLTILLLDWIGVRAALIGLISENLVIPLSTLASGSIIAFLIWRSARLLYDADLKEKQTFAELEEAYKTAEEANRAKDEFMSVVSHELRTPLNSILGWIQVIKAKPTEENMRRAFEVISRQSENQLKLIEDLLDTSRVISGKMRIDVKPVRLEEVIAEAVETVRPAAEAKNIALIYEQTTDLKAFSGDNDRLRQVFWNLFSNAVKFTPKDGEICVRLEQEESNIRITITDTGEGIEADFLPFVFDRFRQWDNSPSRRSGGLGLGLSLVRTIIELHGGSVSAESAGLGKGAIFTILLPIREN